jgi:formylglycine-generating enzyme required for sulfatase activity
LPVEAEFLAMKSARIRARPTVQSDTIGIIKKDSQVWVAGQVRNQECYLVEHGETKGFVYSKLLRAATAAQPAPPSSALGADMMRIEGGCFQMGSSATEAGRQDDERQHRVCVDDFALGQHEVTVDEFRQFINATSYRTEAEKGEGCWVWTGEQFDLDATKHWQHPGFSQDDRHPVVCVSWNDAQAYVEWLSRETGLKYRLPTEAEWEYAARAGTTTARFWGDDPDQACRYASVRDSQYWTDYVHNCRDGYHYTAPVGSFQPNDFGLYDMLGNVWEWTCSVDDEKYGEAEQRCAPAEDSGRRVVRGGSWNYLPRYVRSAHRDWNEPGYRSFGLGFRLAQDL